MKLYPYPERARYYREKAKEYARADAIRRRIKPTPEWQAAHTRRKLAKKERRKHREVAWANRSIISAIYRLARAYRDAGIPCVVDHIIPLQGATVSGLHVHTNLTLLPPELNREKANMRIENPVRSTFVLPQKQVDALKLYSAKSGMPQSEIVRRAITAYIKAQLTPKPQE